MTYAHAQLQNLQTWVSRGRKGLRKNNSLVYGWRDGVIPTRQMRVLGEAEGSHLLLGDLDARRVLGVEPVAHDGEAGLGGGGDAVENGLE